MAPGQPVRTFGSQAPRPGDIIADKYIVDEVLGAGGMGMVVAARHRALKHQVAIKLLLPQAVMLHGAAERFLREAQAAATLRSEHVARVIDMGSREDGAPFLVMEHLAGNDLRKVLRERGALPIDEASEYMLHACEALQEAHAAGILHRDLKPANLFLTSRPNGTPLVKVLDFGLAKLRSPAEGEDPDSPITVTGMVAGSAHYMPPEQFRGLRETDARSDIWSLGAIAYELYTGQRAFRGEGMAGAAAAVLTQAPAPPRSLRPDLPIEIEQLLVRCLEKDPSRRPSRVTELIRVFAAYRIGAPPPPPPPPAPRRVITEPMIGAGQTVRIPSRGPSPEGAADPASPRVLLGASPAAPSPPVVIRHVATPIPPSPAGAAPAPLQVAVPSLQVAAPPAAPGETAATTAPVSVPSEVTTHVRPGSGRGALGSVPGTGPLEASLSPALRQTPWWLFSVVIAAVIAVIGVIALGVQRLSRDPSAASADGAPAASAERPSATRPPSTTDAPEPQAAPSTQPERPAAAPGGKAAPSPPGAGSTPVVNPGSTATAPPSASIVPSSASSSASAPPAATATPTISPASPPTADPAPPASSAPAKGAPTVHSPAPKPSSILDKYD